MAQAAIAAAQAGPPAPAPAPTAKAQAGRAAPPAVERTQAPRKAAQAAPHEEPAKALPKPPQPKLGAAVTAEGVTADSTRAADQGTKLEDAAAPPAAGVGVIVKGGRRVIAIQFAPEAYRGLFRVTIGSGDRERTVRRGPGNVSPVALTAKDLGGGPAAVPITVHTGAGSRSYMLFAPISLRLGETARQAPEANYDNAPLQQVLADFTALTGLIVLAEEPVDRGFTGVVPAGTPGESLKQLAFDLGLNLKQQGRVGYLLSHPQ
jgi:hypothetical protein